MSNGIDQNRLRQIFFIALIILLGILLFIELESYLPALLGAITIFILLHKWMNYLTEVRKWRK
ncbi:MAG TPA: AI-2E family transporter, partial [Chitinophagaceae bacterium]|nr:AI-2E family transporter [Chitinophagaceae bacterium]